MVVIGVVPVPLKCLAHMYDQKETLTVIDYKAKQIGFLKVDLVPCDAKGNEDLDMGVDDPMDLIDKQMCFKIKIHQAMNLPDKFIKVS